MKKILIILLLIFSLNISFNTGYISTTRQKNAVVYIINYENDDLTTNTIDKTKKCLVEMYLSILIDMKVAIRTSNIDSS